MLLWDDCRFGLRPWGKRLSRVYFRICNSVCFSVLSKMHHWFRHVAILRRRFSCPQLKTSNKDLRLACGYRQQEAQLPQRNSASARLSRLANSSWKSL